MEAAGGGVTDWPVTGRAARRDAGVGAWWTGSAREGADLPWRRTRDRYRVLVAEAQLQATPVARVLPYYERFIARWPTAADLAAAELGEVLAAWQGLGLSRAGRATSTRRRGSSRRGLAARRAAHRPARAWAPTPPPAIRCFADGEDVLPVDTNAAARGGPPLPGRAGRARPARGWEAGQAMMDLGRLWCTARAPALRRRLPAARGLPGRRRRGGRSS